MSVYISAEDVDKATRSMSTNKAAGFDNLSIEHVKFAHPSMISVLALLFNMFLITGVVPDDFGLGVTMPIPKFKGYKQKAIADDFRGITICPVLSKIFEYCLLQFFSHVNTSSRQFGFKKNVGCANAHFTVKNIINYFNKGNSTVNVAAIDLLKSLRQSQSLRFTV